jgi:hypothetical protein
VSIRLSYDRSLTLQPQQRVAVAGLDPDAFGDNHLTILESQCRAIEPALTVNQRLSHSPDAQTPARASDHLPVCGLVVRGRRSARRSEPAHATHNARCGRTLPGGSSAQNVEARDRQIWREQASRVTVPSVTMSCERCGAAHGPWGVHAGEGATVYEIWVADNGSVESALTVCRDVGVSEREARTRFANLL